MSEVTEEKKQHDVDYGDPEEDSKIKVKGLADVKTVKGTEEEVCIFK